MIPIFLLLFQFDEEEAEEDTPLEKRKKIFSKECKFMVEKEKVEKFLSSSTSILITECTREEKNKYHNNLKILLFIYKINVYIIIEFQKNNGAA